MSMGGVKGRTMYSISTGRDDVTRSCLAGFLGVTPVHFRMPMPRAVRCGLTPFWSGVRWICAVRSQGYEVVPSARDTTEEQKLV